MNLSLNPMLITILRQFISSVCKKTNQKYSKIVLNYLTYLLFLDKLVEEVDGSECG